MKGKRFFFAVTELMSDNLIIKEENIAEGITVASEDGDGLEQADMEYRPVVYPFGKGRAVDGSLMQPESSACGQPCQD